MQTDRDTTYIARSFTALLVVATVGRCRCYRSGVTDRLRRLADSHSDTRGSFFQTSDAPLKGDFVVTAGGQAAWAGR